MQRRNRTSGFSRNSIILVHSGHNTAAFLCSSFTCVESFYLKYYYRFPAAKVTFIIIC